MTLSIVDMPADEAIQMQSAMWAIEQWKRDFPYDTEQWYLDLYAQAQVTSDLPIVLAAFVDDQFAGTASLIVDDELPGAIEPGPWVAAVFVHASYRKQGIGAALVTQLCERAKLLHYEYVFLYTEHGESWYQHMGWRSLRHATLADHEVVVMSKELEL